MRKSTAIALAAVTLIAIAVRLSPLWSFLYWGSDTGEYLSILRALVRGGRVSTPYYGWGVTYPYFPGMFFAQAGVVDLSGLDVPTTINLVVPVLGALAVLPMFLIGRQMTGDDRFALFAAAFLAGAIPVAYTTAHTAPATVGELLAVAGLLCFVRLRTDGRAMVPLLLVTATLIATHHLSLYFFLIMVLGTIVVEGLARPWRWTPGAKREVAFATVLMAGTFVYWLGYATTFRESILPDVNIQPWWALLALFPAGVVLLAAIIFTRSRLGWRYQPRYPSLRRPSTAYAAAAGAILVIGVVSVVVGVPGTTFQVPASGLLYFVPLVLLLSFSASGRPFGDFLADGLQVNGWLVALLGSAVVGIVAAPRVLIPYRHTEYLMIPLAIFAGIGFFRLLDLAGLRGGKRTLALGVCGLLLAANAVAGIPPPSTLAGWREGTIPSAVDPAYWARDHVSGLVVSDHQGSTTVFGFGGVNATRDPARDPFLPEFANVPYAGPSDIPSPSGAKNGPDVSIDRDMEAGVRLTPWETAAPMDPAVIAKFDAAPFIKVFDNGYARLYWIGWGCAPTRRATPIYGRGSGPARPCASRGSTTQ